MLANAIVLVVVIGLAALAIWRSRKKSGCELCGHCHGSVCHCHDKK